MMITIMSKDLAGSLLEKESFPGWQKERMNAFIRRERRRGRWVVKTHAGLVLKEYKPYEK